MATLTKSQLLALAPAGTTHFLVAELEKDECDSMSDYFATSTAKTVVIGFSKHGKDLFAEMRKAAATFPETAHLGPGKDVYGLRVTFDNQIIDGGHAFWKDSLSPFHRELNDAGPFSTKAEAEAFLAAQPPLEPINFHDAGVATFSAAVTFSSIEHREKYSMGAGYYLKGSGRYSSGWKVRKNSLGWTGPNDTFEVYDGLLAPKAPVKSPATSGSPAEYPAVSAAVGSEPTVTLNAEKQGVEIRFPSKPSQGILDALKARGWRWSRFSQCWYQRDTPATRDYAAGFVAGVIERQAS